MINWYVIQAEPEGEFQVGPKCIIDKIELLLQKHIIEKVKVQWKHLSPEEDTWEIESDMHEAYPVLFQKADMDE